MTEKDIKQHLDQFYKNINDVGNVYHLFSVNMDGEITQEAFGKNVVTDYGLVNRFFHRDSSDYSRYNVNSYLNLYVGNSTTQPTLESSEMINKVISVAATKTSSNTLFGPKRYHSEYGSPCELDMIHGIKYHPAENDKGAFFTQRMNLMEYYYNYNISGVTENITITELGLGESDTKLFSHSLVYDIDGNLTSIVKKPNEKLFIRTYIQGAVPVALIEDLNSQGKSCFIAPYRFSSAVAVTTIQGIPMARGTSVFHGLSTNDIGYEYATENNLESESTHVARLINKPSLKSLLFEKQHHYVSGTLFANGDIDYNTYLYNIYNLSFNDYREGWCCGFNHNPYSMALLIHQLEYIPNNETEHIEREDVYTNNWLSPSFSYAFGIGDDSSYYSSSNNYYNKYGDGRLPMTTMDITSVSMFNYKTKQWDITEGFNSDSTHNYDRSLFSIQCLLIMDINGVATRFGLYCNPFFNIPNQKIKYFDNSGITIYATDSYWDYDSWTQIPNISNVPDELSQKKYYIVPGSSYLRLWPVCWTSTHTSPHMLTSTGFTLSGLVNNHFSGDGRWPTTKMLSNDEGGWILLSRTLIYPDAEGGATSYDISFARDYTVDDLYTGWSRFGNSDRIIIGSAGYIRYTLMTYNDIRIYDVSDPYNPPTYVDIRMPFTNSPTVTAYYNDATDNHRLIQSWSNDGYLCSQQYGYNEACIVNAYDWEGTPRIITDCKLAHINDISNYVVYKKASITNVSTFEVMKAETGEVIDTFTLPEYNTYTVNGILGWKSYVYIHVTYSGVNDIIIYDIDTKTMKFNEKNFDTFQTNFYRKNVYLSESSNDDCYVISTASDNSNLYDYSGIRGPMVFVTKENPTNIRTVYAVRRNPDYWYMAGGFVKYCHDNKSLVFIAKGVQDVSEIDSRFMAFNLGKIISDGTPENSVPWGNRGNNQNFEWGAYKDYIYYFNDASGTDKVIYFKPISWMLPHKVIGDTRTITAFNNPFNISGKQMQLKTTNDMEKVYNYDPSLNTV